jgi:hypothetical protein
MKGYDVVAFDGKRVGRIAGVAGDFYIVERGKVWKSRAPLPKRFARVDEDTHLCPRRHLEPGAARCTESRS